MTHGSRSEAAEGFVEQEREASKILCPECGSDRCYRVERTNFLQKHIYPLFGCYPWACKLCKANFLVRKRYRKKSEKKEYTQ